MNGGLPSCPPSFDFRRGLRYCQMPAEILVSGRSLSGFYDISLLRSKG